MCHIRFALSRCGMHCGSEGQGGTGGWSDVVGGVGEVGCQGLSAGAAELEGHVHKLLPVCWGLIENAGEEEGPLICGPAPLRCDPPVFTHSTGRLSLCLSEQIWLHPKCFPPLYSDSLFVLSVFGQDIAD